MDARRHGSAIIGVAIALSACAFELPALDGGEGGAGGLGASSSKAHASSSATSSASTTITSSASSTGASSSGGTGGGGTGGKGGGDPLVEGCADGTREAYTDSNVEPCIAACDGAFSIAGVNAGPSCGRAGGNDGPHTDGIGCAAEDLCAPGWHLCTGWKDVAAKAKSGACPPQTSNDAYYITRQGMDPSNTKDINCEDPLNDNNTVGCGWATTLMLFGGTPLGSNNCGPLDMILKSDKCGPPGIWSCGGSDHEGTTITKAPGLGGGLCCRDDGAPGC